MKNIIVVVLLGLLFFGTLQFMGKPGPVASQTASTPRQALPNGDFAALRATDYDWPPLKPDNALAPSLLSKNYYLVVDGSGSMSERYCSRGSNKMVVARTAVQSFIDKLPTDANIGLYAFDTAGIGERVALEQNNRAQLKQALQQIVPGGGTPLSTAVKDGYDALTRQAQAQLGYGEYHLVIVTDGVASHGYSPGQEIQQVLNRAPINIHSIGFCLDDRHVLNQPGLTAYRAAGDPSSLMAGLQEVMAETPDFSINTFQE